MSPIQAPPATGLAGDQLARILHSEAHSLTAAPLKRPASVLFNVRDNASVSRPKLLGQAAARPFGKLPRNPIPSQINAPPFFAPPADSKLDNRAGLGYIEARA